MQSIYVGSTVRVGNHTLSAGEVAAGVPPRLPFVGDDGVTPIDPDAAVVILTAPTGVQRSFGWPTQAAEDTGLLTKQETGRFYVDWTPDDPEDGKWIWELGGKRGAPPTSGSGQTDRGVFFVNRSTASWP